MKLGRILAVIGGVAALSGHAGAAEIQVLCSNGLKAVMQELAPQFERASEHKLVVKYGLAAALKQQIEAGEPFDLAILTPPMMDDVIKQGRVAAETRTVIARAGIGVAIRAGAARPDIGNADAFKRVLLDAKSISYAKAGASGVYFAGLVQRLGIADAITAKARVKTTGDEVGEAVAHGDAELGVLPISEILPVHGIEVLGPFPAELQSYVVMTAGLEANASKAAADLLKFLKAPGALPVIAAKGMEPG